MSGQKCEQRNQKSRRIQQIDGGETILLCPRQDRFRNAQGAQAYKIHELLAVPGRPLMVPAQMAAQSPTGGGNNVFLNVPLDTGYEKLFVALIATIVAARLTPRCAVEISVTAGPIQHAV